MAEYSPPGSNEETVNSPKLDSPLFYGNQAHCSSYSSPSSESFCSPPHIDILQRRKYHSNKTVSSDVIWNPHSALLRSSDALRSPDTMSVTSGSTASPSHDLVYSSDKQSTFSVDINQSDNKPLKRDSLSSVSSSSVSSSSERCSVCGDKADSDHFDVTVCYSCRGFFKRAIKNNRKYSCMEKRSCLLTKKTRNHCQHCRLAVCHKVGMNVEAVKAEIGREKREKLEKKKASKETSESSSSDTVHLIDLKLISGAELFVDPKISSFANVAVDPIRQICLAADKQLASLAEWAKRLPHFVDLDVIDQVKLLQWNWPELLIGGFCYRSSAVSNGILLSTGLHLSRENLEKVGVGTLVNKLFAEVINKMQTLQIDISEWGCIRAIMLFAPDTKELKAVDQVEQIRNYYIATLYHYVKETYPNDTNRIGKLLLRLPPLKAIALQVLEHLFFFKLIGDVPIDTFLLEMLDVDNH